MTTVQCPQCGVWQNVAGDARGVPCERCRGPIDAPPPAEAAGSPLDDQREQPAHRSDPQTEPAPTPRPAPAADRPLARARVVRRPAAGDPPPPPPRRERAFAAGDPDDEGPADRPRRRPKPASGGGGWGWGRTLLGLAGGGLVTAFVVCGIVGKVARTARKVGNVTSTSPETAHSHGPAAGPAAGSLSDARKGFATNLTRRERGGDPLSPPPPNLFKLVKYDSPAGQLGAYLTPDPRDGQKHPAIVWITGGDCNTVDEVWKEGRRENEQTASAYRKAGIVMMFPSLRGGNDNPGVKEGFLGEIDDVLAAADFLAKQDYVDPSHIYLGGHSTGGTVALLAAESTDRFRAVFSFGPVEDVAGYGPELCPFNLNDSREVEVRSPGRWLHSVKSPVFVFEGTNRGNLDSLQAMQRTSANPLAHFYPVRGGGHFDILDPLNRLIVTRILADAGPKTNIKLTEMDVEAAFRNPPPLPTPTRRPPNTSAPDAPKPTPPGPSDWATAGADTVRLSNPRVGKSKTGREGLQIDYDIAGDRPPGAVVVLAVTKVDGRASASGVVLPPGTQGTLTLNRATLAPGTEVWLARLKPGAKPEDESERISNTVTVPRPATPPPGTKPDAPAGELVKLSNPRAGKTKAGRNAVVVDYELTGPDKPDQAVVIVIKSGTQTFRQSLLAGWQEKGTLTLGVPRPPGAGTEVWLGKRPAKPADEPEKISNVAVIPDPAKKDD